MQGLSFNTQNILHQITIFLHKTTLVITIPDCNEQIVSPDLFVITKLDCMCLREEIQGKDLW